MADAVTARSYRRRLAAAMAGGPAVRRVYYMAFGDGGHRAEDFSVIPPDPDQEGLNHEVLRKELASVVQDDLYSVTGRGVLEAHELVGIRLSEAALFDADGKIVGIKNFSPKFKESDERYEISIKLRF